MTPPDPWSLHPRDLARLLFLGRRFRDLPSEDRFNQVQLMTMSAVDFLDQWFETDVLKATMSAQRHHRHVPGRALAGHGLRAAAPLHGRDRRRVPLVGPRARRHRRHLRMRLRPRRAQAGVEIRTEAPIARIVVRENRARGVVLENGDEIEADLIASSVDPRRTFLTMVGEELLPDEFVEGVKRYQVPRLVRQGEPRARWPAGLHRLPGAGPHLRGAISISPERRLHGARLRRCEVRDGSRGGRTSTW